MMFPFEKRTEWGTRIPQDLILTAAMRLVGSGYVVGPVDGLPFGNSSPTLRPFQMPQALTSICGLTKAPRWWCQGTKDILVGSDHGESCCARAVLIGRDESTTVARHTLYADDGMEAGKMHGNICKTVLAGLNVKFDIKAWHDSRKGMVSHQSLQWWQEDESEALYFGEHNDTLEATRVKLANAGFSSSDKEGDDMCDSPLAKVQRPVRHVVRELACMASWDAEVMEGSFWPEPGSL